MREGYKFWCCKVTHNNKNVGNNRFTEKGDVMKQTQAMKKNHLFKRLYHRGRYQVTPFLAVYVLENRQCQEKQENMLGITVGVKLGGAVVRNKVRRRLKEAYRLLEPQLHTGYHIVIVARNRCATATYAQINQSLIRLCDQLQLSLHPTQKPNFLQPGQKPTPNHRPQKQGNKGQKSKGGQQQATHQKQTVHDDPNHQKLNNDPNKLQRWTGEAYEKQTAHDDPNHHQKLNNGQNKLETTAQNKSQTTAKTTAQTPKGEPQQSQKNHGTPRPDPTQPQETTVTTPLLGATED